MSSSSPPCHPLPDSIFRPALSFLMRDETIDKIDAEMTRLEYQLHSLRRLHNIKIPISRFPPEILSKIFLICHEQDTKAPNLRLVLSWVSHYWRSVALGYAALWTAIQPNLELNQRFPSSTPSYVQQCIVRSKRMPLDIDYREDGSEALTLIGTQIDRIRKLRLVTYFGEHSGLPLPDTWQCPAPLLVDLELFGSSLEGDLFGGVYPNLQCVTLTHCVVPWNSPLITLSTLTTLKIYQPDGHITPELLIPMFQSLPALRSCGLRSCFDSDAGDTSDGARVRLPHLEDISVMDEDEEAVLDFLGSLDLSSASVEAIYEAQEIHEGRFIEFLDLFKEYREDSESEPWKDICTLIFRRKILDEVTDSFTITLGTEKNRRITCGIGSGVEKFKYDPVAVCASWLHEVGIRDVRKIHMDTPQRSIGLSLISEFARRNNPLAWSGLSSARAAFVILLLRPPSRHTIRCRSNVYRIIWIKYTFEIIFDFLRALLWIDHCLLRCGWRLDMRPRL